MKNTRKGFTGIELVIVIAIIAILAASLIPSFGGLFNSANKTSDTMQVREMNTALLQYTLQNGEPETVGELKNGLDALGINPDGMVPSAKGYAFYWNKTANEIVLVGGDVSAEEGWLLLSTNGYGVPTNADSNTDFQTLINESKNQAPVLFTLTEDITLDSMLTLTGDDAVVFDLNGKTLTAGEGQNAALFVKNGASLTVKNGTVNADMFAIANTSASLTLENVTVNTAGNYQAVFFKGISDTNIINCTIISGGQGVGSNSSDVTSDGSRVSIVDSKITGNGGSAVYVPIYAVVNIENCVLTGNGEFGLSLYGCVTDVKNTTINNGRLEILAGRSGYSSVSRTTLTNVTIDGEIHLYSENNGTLYVDGISGEYSFMKKETATTYGTFVVNGEQVQPAEQ